MSKFNTNKTASETPVSSYEGGTVYERKLEDEWQNMLFSSVLEDGYYESAATQTDRYIDLTRQMADKYGEDFVAKAAVFSRNVLGLRSISALTAALLNSRRFEGKRGFYASYFHRPDDVAEVFAAVKTLDDKRSHGLIRGAADYVSGLDDYRLGKYQMRGKEFNLLDLVNLTHAHSDAIDRLKASTLRTPDTWEVAISAAENEDTRAREWIRLVEEGKLGYLALIRNLRNIVKAAATLYDVPKSNAWLADELALRICDKTAIERSLVYPHQIYAAWVALQIAQMACPASVEQALETAFIASLVNMPAFDGTTAVIVDVSGSMQQTFSKFSSLSILQISAVFAAAFLMLNPTTQVVKFGSAAKLCDYANLRLSPFRLIEAISDNEGMGYSTNITAAFDAINVPADRILLFSDMQVMDASYDDYYSCYVPDCRSGFDAYRAFKRRCACAPHIYSFDLGNYHSQLTPPKTGDISYITTLNDKVFRIAKMQESGKTLVDIIQEWNVVE